MFFAFSRRFCSGLKIRCKHRVKVNKNHPKPSFLHTVSAESRCFESTFKKTIFIRDRLQKLRNLSLFQLFYSITFLVEKTLLSREKNCPGVQNGRFRTPRVAKVAVAAVPCVFFDAHVEITLFLSSGSLVKVHFGLPGASWRLLAAGWLLPGVPWCPLVPPGDPWWPLVVTWQNLSVIGWITFKSADPRSECQNFFRGRGLPLPYPSPLGGPIQQVAKFTRKLV